MKSHPTPRQALVEQLFESMNTLKRGMYSQLHVINRDLPISRSQIELLMAIRHAQPVSFKELAKQLCLTPGAISQLAEGLEQLELIERKTSIADRRLQYLETSKKGATLLQDVEKRRRKLLETVMQDLSDEELELWLRIQQKMINQFQSETTETK